MDEKIDQHKDTLKGMLNRMWALEMWSLSQNQANRCRLKEVFCVHLLFSKEKRDLCQAENNLILHRLHSLHLQHRQIDSIHDMNRWWSCETNQSRDRMKCLVLFFTCTLEAPCIVTKDDWIRIRTESLLFICERNYTRRTAGKRLTVPMTVHGDWLVDRTC